jgi:hypothetical protein
MHHQQKKLVHFLQNKSTKRETMLADRKQTKQRKNGASNERFELKTKC